MKILFIAQYFPYPPTSGGLSRTYNLIKLLSKNHELTLWSFTIPDEPLAAEQVQHMNEFCREVIITPIDEAFADKKRPPYTYMIKRMLYGAPWFVKAYSSYEARVQADVLSRRDYDLVHVDALGIAFFADYFQTRPRLLNEHNVEAQILKRKIEYEGSLKDKVIAYFDFRKVDKFERRFLKTFDHITVVSEDDAKHIRRLSPNVSVTLVPNGVDLKFFSETPYKEKDDTLVFTGLMNWGPNVDAVLYFTESIWPHIQKMMPAARFLIVGREPTDKIRELTQNDSIIVTGFVDDVRPYVWKSKVFVVPIRFGGGTRLKILEAMAMGIPVVSTTIGCEGIEVEDGKNIIICDDPAEFAQAVISLMDDGSKRERLGRAGRKLVEEKYGWPNIAAKLEQAYHQCVEDFKNKHGQ